MCVFQNTWAGAALASMPACPLGMCPPYLCLTATFQYNVFLHNYISTCRPFSFQSIHIHSRLVPSIPRPLLKSLLSDPNSRRLPVRAPPDTQKPNLACSVSRTSTVRGATVGKYSGKNSPGCLALTRIVDFPHLRGPISKTWMGAIFIDKETLCVL